MNDFNKFMRAYLDEQVAIARERGFVETLMGRRRHIPELQAKNWNVRQFGERVAQNTPIQGTAADMIKNAPKVTGFPGGATPAPLSEEEIKAVMDQIKGESARPKPKFSFEKGENVRVIDGPFVNFNGTVEDINPDKGKVRVMVSIFGRATPVELEFPQIERI